MISKTIRIARILGVLFLIVLTAEVSRADLFAVNTASSEVLRLNSNTGALIDTYPINPIFPAPLPVNTGLAFDGRRVYVNFRLAPGLDELWMLELASRSWFPLGVLDTVPVDPTGLARFSGLAYAPDEFGQVSLTAVSVRTPDVPSHLVRYPAFPFFSPFEPILPSSLAAPLPPDFDADGLDYDPSTGELWVAGEQVDGTTRTPMLLHTDLAGSVIRTLSPVLGDATIPRGLAFDNGRMFVAVRRLPTTSNEVHEIDRVTGAVLNTFVVPGDGMIAALTGGTVIPEPATVALGLAFLIAACGPRRPPRTWIA